MNHLKGFGVVRLKSSAQFKQKDSYRANKVLQSKQGSDCAMRCKQKYFKEMMTDIGNDPLTSFKFDKVIIYGTRDLFFSSYVWKAEKPSVYLSSFISSSFQKFSTP